MLEFDELNNWWKIKVRILNIMRLSENGEIETL